MSDGLDNDIIGDIEEFLDDSKFGEKTDVIDSEGIFLNKDSEEMDSTFEEESEVLFEDNLETESEQIDVNIENDDELLENNTEDLSEVLDKDSKDVSPPKKSKKEETSRYRPLNLPLARIKQIIKMDPDVHLAGADAVFLIAKATELFIELLSKDAYTHTVAAKKKTIQKKDVDAAILNTDALVFLDGALDF